MCLLDVIWGTFPLESWLPALSVDVLLGLTVWCCSFLNIEFDCADVALFEVQVWMLSFAVFDFLDFVLFENPVWDA